MCFKHFLGGSGKACKRRLITHTALFVFLTLLLAVAPSPASAANRGIAITVKTADGQTLPPYKHSYALLVGVSHYKIWPSLDLVPSELKTVKKALQDQGFTVITRIDPDSAALENAFNDFIKKYGYSADNRLLFYYAGHGYTLRDGDNGYLVPVNAPDPRKDKTGFKRAALDMNMLMAWCRSMDARHALFLFDSCFSGAIFKQRDLPDMPPAVSRMAGEPVRQFITAGRANETVPAKSTFTPAFVDALAYGRGDLNHDGYVSGTELGLYLQSEVPRHVHQTPQYGKINDYDLSRGDFIFLAGGSTLITQPSPTATGSGTLKIDAAPSGVRVFVNNADKGTAPLQLSGLSPGDYQVRAEKTGYAPQSRKVTVRAGSLASVRFYLDEVKQAGRLYVHPDPADARVRIMNINPAYYDGIELAPGRYQVQVEKPGYESVTQWEPLAAGQTRDIYITLKKAVPIMASSVGGPSFTNDLGMDFVYIQPGTFMMGSPSNESGRDDDERQHRVTLTRGFYMQTTEVTQGQWRAVMGNNPSHFSSCGSNCPVEEVSWNDAQAFIRKLNQRTGKNCRLPTEAEWEYACRAGTTGRYSWGDSINCSKANYGNGFSNECKGQNPGETMKVGRFSPNAWGLYDMHGNVWEWCQDWYDKNYPSGSVTDPTGPSSGSDRVLRGGSWSRDARYCRSAARDGSEPGIRDGILGFRLVLPQVR